VLFYGAKLTGENIVDVGVSFPGNGARKLDGAESTVYEMK
jgi:hypothetical protein